MITEIILSVIIALLLGIIVFQNIWFTRFVAKTNEERIRYLKAFMAKNLNEMTSAEVAMGIKEDRMEEEVPEYAPIEEVPDDIFDKHIKGISKEVVE